jgi:hypothetical protein
LVFTVEKNPSFIESFRQRALMLKNFWEKIARYKKKKELFIVKYVGRRWILQTQKERKRQNIREIKRQKHKKREKYGTESDKEKDVVKKVNEKNCPLNSNQVHSGIFYFDSSS